MKKQILIFAAIVCGMTYTTTAYAQFKIGGKKINVGKVVQAGTDAAKAITLSDADIVAMSKEYMQWMDTHNPLTKPDTEYGKRLEKLTGHIKEVDGLKVNFGVYEVIDVNAFACGDGGVQLRAGQHQRARVCGGRRNDGELLHHLSYRTHHHAQRGTRSARQRDRALSGGRREVRRSDEDENGYRFGDGKRARPRKYGEVSRIFRRGRFRFQRFRKRQRIYQFVRTYLRYRSVYL